jgi:hypothetical protein
MCIRDRSLAEPVWRPAGARMGVAMPAAPIAQVVYDPWAAAGPRSGTTNPIVTATAVDAAWRQRAVAAAHPAPLPQASYTPRAVSEAPAFRQVTHSAPPTVTVSTHKPAAPPPVPRPAAKVIHRPPPPTVATLRAGIEQACAGRGRDVEVYARGASSLLVRIKVRQAADAEFLANRISQLPELGPYQVLYEMQLVR